MHRHPLPGHHAGGEPQPEAEEVAYRQMQIERPMGLRTMQKDRNGHDGDMGQDQPGHNHLPQGEIQDSVPAHQGASGIKMAAASCRRRRDARSGHGPGRKSNTGKCRPVGWNHYSQ